MTALEYYPSFTSYSDNHGNTAEGLMKDVSGIDVKFDSPIFRPGDKLEIRVRAEDPRDRKLEVAFRRSFWERTPPLPTKTINSGDEAVLVWEITDQDVGAGVRFRLGLTALGTEYHRMNSSDQILSISYRIDPPADY